MCASHQCLFLRSSHEKIQSSLRGFKSNSTAASAPTATGNAMPNSALPVSDGLLKRLRESVQCGSSPTLYSVSDCSNKGGVMSRFSDDALVKFPIGIFASAAPGGCCIVFDS